MYYIYNYCIYIYIIYICKDIDTVYICIRSRILDDFVISRSQRAIFSRDSHIASAPTASPPHHQVSRWKDEAMIYPLVIKPSIGKFSLQWFSQRKKHLYTRYVQFLWLIATSGERIAARYFGRCKSASPWLLLSPAGHTSVAACSGLHICMIYIYICKYKHDDYICIVSIYVVFNRIIII